METAKSKQDLAKRISRFLARETTKDKKLSELITILGYRLNLYLFGGAIRDIALYGNRDDPSDIDIVYAGTGDDEFVESLLNDRFAFERNKFGGFRIPTNHWSVDFWCARNTWAIQRGYCEYEGVYSLLDTTITNRESILYAINTRSVICKKDYLENLERRYLDIVCAKNPNSLGMFVRVIRAFAISHAELLSREAALLLRNGLLNYSFDQVRSYEVEHYRSSYVDKAIYDYLFAHTDTVDSDTSDVKVGSIVRTAPLFDAIREC